MSNGTIDISADTSSEGLDAFNQAMLDALTPTAGSGSSGGLGGLLGNFFTGGAADSLLGAGLGYNLFDDQSALGKIAQEEALKIGERAKADTAFRPFTVSTGFGGVTTTPEGGYATALAPSLAGQQQQLQGITSGLLGGMGGVAPDVSGIQQQALGGVGGFLTSATAPMAQREADVYERIRATQRPEEQRQQLALEERLAAQGRTGLRTAQFGGSPEQLALAQAQEEAKAKASLAALGQAQAEQLQQMGLAESMFGLGGRAAGLPQALQLGQLQNIISSQAAQYLPEQQLLASMTPALNLASISDAARREGAGLRAESAMSGLEGRIAAEKTRTEGLSGLYSALLGAQGNVGAAAAGGATGSGGLLSALAGLI
jgi:hypothetical protein